MLKESRGLHTVAAAGLPEPSGCAAGCTPLKDKPPAVAFGGRPSGSSRSAACSLGCGAYLLRLRVPPACSRSDQLAGGADPGYHKSSCFITVLLWSLLTLWILKSVMALRASGLKASESPRSSFKGPRLPYLLPSRIPGPRVRASLAATHADCHAHLISVPLPAAESIDWALCLPARVAFRTRNSESTRRPTLLSGLPPITLCLRVSCHRRSLCGRLRLGWTRHLSRQTALAAARRPSSARVQGKG